MRVLVIGGTGVISTAIVDRLHELGHEPVLFNRGKTQSRIKKEAEVIIGERQNFPEFAAKMQGLTVDAVIDMITYDPNTAANAIEVFSGRVGQYVFCSTVCALGPLSRIPGQDDEPYRPTGAYGINKAECERLFLRAHREAGFPVTILRPSYTYGPGAPLIDLFGVDAAVITRIREGRPLIVHGLGDTLWQACLASDCAKGFVGVLTNKKTIGESYNVVADEFFNWRRYYEIMAKAAGCEANIVSMTLEQILAGAPPEKTGFFLRDILQYHAYYSNERLKAVVPEFRDFVPFEEGAKQAIAWMDASKAHKPSDTQAFIDAMVKEESAFRERLQRLGA